MRLFFAAYAGAVAQRARVHKLARKAGLKSQSDGADGARVMTVWKPDGFAANAGRQSGGASARDRNGPHWGASHSKAAAVAAPVVRAPTSNATAHFVFVSGVAPHTAAAQVAHAFAGRACAAADAQRVGGADADDGVFRVYFSDAAAREAALALRDVSVAGAPIVISEQRPPRRDSHFDVFVDARNASATAAAAAAGGATDNGVAAASNAAQWMCSVCESDNAGHDAVCVVCFVPRAGEDDDGEGADDDGDDGDDDDDDIDDEE